MTFSKKRNVRNSWIELLIARPINVRTREWRAGLNMTSTSARQRGTVFRGSIDAMKLVEARYEYGLLRPTKPLALRPGERANLIVVRQPDPDRWNLDRLVKSSTEEDFDLAEQGLTDWSAKLHAEDRS